MFAIFYKRENRRNLANITESTVYKYCKILLLNYLTASVCCLIYCENKTC